MAITPQVKIRMTSEYLECLNKQQELRMKMRESGIDIDALERVVGLDNGAPPPVNSQSEGPLKVKLTKTGRVSPGETLRVLRMWIFHRWTRGQRVQNYQFRNKGEPGHSCSPSCVSAGFKQLEAEGVVKGIKEGEWEVQ